MTGGVSKVFQNNMYPDYDSNLELWGHLTTAFNSNCLISASITTSKQNMENFGLYKEHAVIFPVLF